MAKNTFTLRQGHPTTFRRTINPEAQKRQKPIAEEGDQSYQLVIEPGTHYEFSDAEIAGLQKEIDSGLLVPSDLDQHGRQRAVKPERTDKPAPESSRRKTRKAGRKVAKATGQTTGKRKAKGVNVGSATGASKKSEGATK